MRILLASLCVSASLAAAAPVSYYRDVKPLLTQRCVPCHQSANRSGGVTFESVANLPPGPKILSMVSGPSPKMPKAGPPLNTAELDLLRRWIAEGSKDDTPAAAKQNAGIWWSLRPLPSTVDSRQTIDTFIRAKLSEKNLPPSEPADRRTLIRRVTYDLTGLPPTNADIAAFLADQRPDAYERLVDRLLASPRYGERWARHWLDAVHYGDTHGYDKDKTRNNAWPYRDYVIESLNKDKPYPQFVREQMAGDVLHPDDPESIIATGFIAAGPWDFVGHQELREGSTEKNNTRNLDRDDMVMASVSTFVSMTAHCARCHDHKFDPIPQEDYYRLQAVFAGVDRADRPYDSDAKLSQQRRTLIAQRRALQQKLQPLLDKVEFAESPQLTLISDRISDAKLLLAHLGAPKTPQEEAEKKTLTDRVAADQVERKKELDRVIGPEIYRAIDAVKDQIKPVDAQLAALPQPQYIYAASNYFNIAGTFRPALSPRPVFLLDRGSVSSPLREVQPGALSALKAVAFQSPANPQDEGARRLALANWFTDQNNVLFWRSIVNRVWHYHFGNGIVDTPNDFGHMGSLPTHPELLDWLAVWFRDQAHGSLKQLNRMIVLSETYRQSSVNRPDAAKIDADNRLLWRMNRERLDAEEVRDTVLSAAGKLDLTMGGPGVRMFWFKDDHSPIYDYNRFDPDGPGAYRRSIYRFTVRSVADPFMDRLDCPDASILAPKRSLTLTAIQALALWNNPFMLRMSEHLAERAQGNADEAVRLTLEREPTPREHKLYTAYAAKHGMVNLARLLLNTNEFLFVD